MPHSITPTRTKVVCTPSHTDAAGAKKAQTSYNVFFWNTGEPSIFATPAALRYARASATSSANVTAQQRKKKRVVPDIKTRNKRKGVDVDRLHNLMNDGYTQVECAAIFGVSRESIRRRLGLEKPRIRDNTASSFNTPIATKAQSDRTNSIRRLA